LGHARTHAADARERIGADLYCGEGMKESGSLRATPAMKVGITDHVYSLGELLAWNKSRDEQVRFKGTGLQSIAPQIKARQKE
jgi:hypothetical protein